jgi:hypothetical protein
MVLRGCILSGEGSGIHPLTDSAAALNTTCIHIFIVIGKYEKAADKGKLPL